MDTCVSNDKVDFDAGHRETLAAYLERWAADEPARRDIAVTVEALAKAAMAISGILALGALSGPLGAVTGKQGGADPQRELDVLANDRIIASLAGTPVALLVSEELSAVHDFHHNMLARRRLRGAGPRNHAILFDEMSGASDARTAVVRSSDVA